MNTAAIMTMSAATSAEKGNAPGRRTCGAREEARRSLRA